MAAGPNDKIILSNEWNSIRKLDSDSENPLDSVTIKEFDVLDEIYWYVIRDQEIASDDLTVGHLVESLKEEGILFWRDRRFHESQNVALRLAKRKRGRFSAKIGAEDQAAAADVPLGIGEFVDVVCPCAQLFLKAFSEELVIQDWTTFTTDMTHHFYDVENIKDGTNAGYIPILKNADSEKWGLSICSTDGQRFSLGDVDAKHTLQSTSKPVTYALDLQREGKEYMDQWIGVEPAGRPFDTQDLEPDTYRPYNCSVNSGAIMASGIYASVYPDLTWKEIVDKIRETWFDLCGNDLEVGFSKETFESEKATAFNNFAIAYNLKGRKGLPRDVDLHKMLDVYLGCCSIEMTAEALAVAAATLANGGVCPITSKEVFPAHVVRHVLSETMTCGMYDQSGHFAVEVGLPAKSGVSGALMVIVPNLCGFATFSPRLNERGNSVRGVEFCKRLVASHRIHTFEPLRSGSNGAKIDPRKNGWKNEQANMLRLAWSFKVGDVAAIRLRDIFLFALCRVAVSTNEGLTDKSIDLIRRRYNLAYQAPVDESHLQEVVDSVKQQPSSLKILEELIGDLSIPDEMRSVILVAMADVLTIDCEVEEIETTIASKVCGLLGVDEDVARMKIDRITNRCGHRYNSATPLDTLGSGQEFQLSLLEKNIKRSSSKHDLAELAHQVIDNENEHSLVAENIHLRKEVYRMKMKIDRLTELLQKRQQP